MVGSHGSNPRKGITRRLFAALALLALVATACGGTSTSETTTAPAARDDADYGSWGDSNEAQDADVAGDSSDAAPSEPTDGGDQAPALGAKADDAVAPSGETLTMPAQTAQVLAYAIEAGEELSYSFEQGMSMQMSMLGMDLDISPDAAFVTGEVSGTDSRVRVDLGSFMTAMFDSMGMDLSDPLFAGVFGDLESMTMEVWIVDSTMVVDMTGLAASIAGMDPTAAGELSVFADGPVAIDLAALDGLGTTDAASLVQQFGQGAQVTDPAAMIDALRQIEAVTETGSSTVGETPVTVYEARLSMADYYAALGMDITDQMGSMESFGVAPGSEEAEMVEAMLPALEELHVDMTIMLDADGLVRRIESSMDMGAMMSSMMGEIEGSDELGLGEIDVVIDTWQNFADYGSDITITAPAATDRTSDFAGLIAS